jgi:hypothetical protein
MIEDDAEDDCVGDAELLGAHVAGNPDPFAVLVKRHQDRMWAIALRIMRNPEDAADALQDAYIGAFRRAGSYRGDAQVTSWLHQSWSMPASIGCAPSEYERPSRCQRTLIDGAGWAAP